MKSIFPPRPSGKTFTPPTKAENDMFRAKLIECMSDEIEGFGNETSTKHRGFEHPLFRLVWALKHISVSEARRDELHKHLYVFEELDRGLLAEAKDLGPQIDAKMAGEHAPAGKTALISAIVVEHVPADTFVQRYMDAKVGKVSATWKEFQQSYPTAEIVGGKIDV